MSENTPEWVNTVEDEGRKADLLAALAILRKVENGPRGLIAQRYLDNMTKHLHNIQQCMENGTSFSKFFRSLKGGMDTVRKYYNEGLVKYEANKEAHDALLARLDALDARHVACVEQEESLPSHLLNDIVNQKNAVIKALSTAKLVSSKLNTWETRLQKAERALAGDEVAKPKSKKKKTKTDMKKKPTSLSEKMEKPVAQAPKAPVQQKKKKKTPKVAAPVPEPEPEPDVEEEEEEEESVAPQQAPEAPAEEVEEAEAMEEEEEEAEAMEEEEEEEEQDSSESDAPDPEPEARDQEQEEEEEEENESDEQEESEPEPMEVDPVMQYEDDLRYTLEEFKRTIDFVNRQLLATADDGSNVHDHGDGEIAEIKQLRGDLAKEVRRIELSLKTEVARQKGYDVRRGNEIVQVFTEIWAEANDADPADAPWIHDHAYEVAAKHATGQCKECYKRTKDDTKRTIWSVTDPDTNKHVPLCGFHFLTQVMVPSYDNYGARYQLMSEDDERSFAPKVRKQRKELMKHYASWVNFMDLHKDKEYEHINVDPMENQIRLFYLLDDQLPDKDGAMLDGSSEEFSARERRRSRAEQEEDDDEMDPDEEFSFSEGEDGSFNSDDADVIEKYGTFRPTYDIFAGQERDVSPPSFVSHKKKARKRRRDNEEREEEFEALKRHKDVTQRLIGAILKDTLARRDQQREALDVQLQSAAQLFMGGASLDAVTQSLDVWDQQPEVPGAYYYAVMVTPKDLPAANPMCDATFGTWGEANDYVQSLGPSVYTAHHIVRVRHP